MWDVAWLSYYVAEPLLWAVSFLFVFLYSCLQPWWRHLIGWTLSGLVAGLALILTPHMLRFLGVDVNGTFFQWFVFVVFLLVPGWIVSQTLILCRVSRWKFRLPWHHPRPSRLSETLQTQGSHDQEDQRI